jgi:hypothetical protein
MKGATMLTRVLLLLTIFCVATVGCAAEHKHPVTGPDCERTCLERWDTCKKACLRVVDPSAQHAGARETCERVCQTDKDTCDLGCLKGRAR